ncbi:MAG: hypothetical protein LQ349_003746 [Xanthoria aureola]|nr:MAG: hypothetical protein LQ349_003746 [Xanthoria aureola]
MKRATQGDGPWVLAAGRTPGGKENLRTRTVGKHHFSRFISSGCSGTREPQILVILILASPPAQQPPPPSRLLSQAYSGDSNVPCSATPPGIIRCKKTAETQKTSQVQTLLGNDQPEAQQRNGVTKPADAEKLLSAKEHAIRNRQR